MTSYAYDRRDLLTGISQQYANPATGPSTTVRFAYDGLGQKLTETVSIAGTLFNSWAQTWDGAGRRVSLTSSLPAQANGSFSYGYRADGLLATVTSAGEVFGYTYDDNGLLAARSNPWRTLTIDSRDPVGRITKISNRIGAEEVLSGSLSWRNDSRIDTYSETRTGASESHRYTYNDRGQLLSEPFGSGSNAFTYQFDGDQTGTGPGVRTLAATQETPVISGSSIPNCFLQVVRDQQVEGDTGSISWGYDQLGALVSGSSSKSGTQSFKWDSLGRLISATQRDSSGNGLDWTAIYDGLGRRLRTVQQPVGSALFTSGTLDSCYDPQVEFLELGIALNGARTWKIHGPDLSGQYGAQQGIGGLEALVAGETGAITPVLNDYFGNIVATLSGGTVLWNPGKAGAYGMLPGPQPPVLDTANSNPALCSVWRGKRIDPTGLYYMGARYYDPQGGRFISPDPLGHEASIDLYSYANGDPVNGLDPDGRCSLLVDSNGSLRDDEQVGALQRTAFENQRERDLRSGGMGAQLFYGGADAGTVIVDLTRTMVEEVPLMVASEGIGAVAGALVKGAAGLASESIGGIARLGESSLSPSFRIPSLISQEAGSIINPRAGLELYAKTDIQAARLTGNGHKLAKAVASQFYTKEYSCADCATAIETEFLDAGIRGGKRIELTGHFNDNVISDAAAESGVPGGTIGINGKHVGVLYKGIVYDNLPHSGIPLDEWLSDIHMRKPPAVDYFSFPSGR